MPDTRALERMKVECGTDRSQADLAVIDLLNAVGNRVRDARKARGISRNDLSVLSGVSARHLANLETGEGNISIGLLKRIALALESPMSGLIGSDDNLQDEARAVAVQFSVADAATRRRVTNLLDPGRAREMKAERICLIGLRGAGKSTLGSLVATECGIPFVEMNRAIEDSAGVPISEIFSLYGEDGYRQLEADAVNELILSEDRVVVAASGGVVANTDTYSQILERFHTIWLQASPLEHMDRVRTQGDLRPIEGNPRALLQLRQILKTREPEYHRADFHISTTGKGVEDVFQELNHMLHTNALIGGAS